jgi:lipid II:glycine glycyltransferase (peptidoglycan interpeptide bridge formation enzyme)
MHAYFIVDNTVRLLHSCSLFRDTDDHECQNLVGRANRLLHWDDILYFKRNNYLLYDFGGIYQGDRDKEKIQIAQFKNSFGGEIKCGYSYMQPVTFKGMLYLLIFSLIRSLKNNDRKN